MTAKNKIDQYLVNEKGVDFIPLATCKHGWLYRIHSRNLDFVVFNQGTNGFIGIREKFGDRYLFTEFHYDAGAPYGTVKPLQELEKVPDGIPVSTHLTHDLDDLWAENPITNQVEAVVRRNWHVYNGESYVLDPNRQEAPHGSRQGFADYWVNTMTRLPDKLYPFLRENEPLFKYLDKFNSLT